MVLSADKEVPAHSEPGRLAPSTRTVDTGTPRPPEGFFFYRALESVFGHNRGTGACSASTGTLTFLHTLKPRPGPKDTFVREFTWPVRVYYEDTDAGGIVYHANYLRFIERARTEWLRALGFEQDQLLQELRILFAVRSLEADYLKPARFNDRLNVVTVVARVRRASLEFEQTVTHGDAPAGQPLFRARVKVACLSADGLRPAAMPTPIQAALKKQVLSMETHDAG